MDPDVSGVSSALALASVRSAVADLRPICDDTGGFVIARIAFPLKTRSGHAFPSSA